MKPKFRLWEPLNQRMKQVNLCFYEGSGDAKRFVLPFEDQGTQGSYTVMNLDAVIIMQYTGLNDTNGTEIYEGDILVAYWDDHNIREKTVVRWSDNGQWSISKNRIASRGHIVIGNIYEGVDGKPWQP